MEINSIDQIYNTPPLYSDYLTHYSIHMVVCSSHLTRTLWSLKSFYINSGVRFRPVFHDDGTLQEVDIFVLKHHFPDCIVVDKKRADEDMEKILGNYEGLKSYRDNHFYALKFFDCLFFNTSVYYIVLDDDILWYNYSSKLIDLIAESKPFYFDCGGEGCVRNTNYMEKMLGIKACSNFNSGCIGCCGHNWPDLDYYQSVYYDLIQAPYEYREGNEIKRTIGVGAGISGKIDISQMEQTLWAIYLHPDNYKATPTYAFPFDGHLAAYGAPPNESKVLNHDTIMHHHFWDSRFNTFYEVGVKYLIENGFLETVEQKK